MKTTIKGLALGLAILLASTGRASIGTDTLGQAYLNETLAAIESGEREKGLALLACADEAYRAADDLEGWLKLYKEAGKALRQSEWQDATLQAVRVMQWGLHNDFGRSPVTAEEWDALIWLHVNLGYIHLHYQDDYQKALVEYEEAYRLFQRHFEADDYYTVNYIYRPLANLYSRFGDFQTATGLLSTAYRYFKATARTTAMVKVLNDLAIAEELAGQPEASLEHIDEALSQEGLSPKDLVMLHSARARIRNAMGDHESALRSVDLSLAVLPEVEQVPPAYLQEWEGNLWNVRGRINAALKKWEASAADFAKGEAVLDKTGSISYRRSLGKLLTDKGRMLEGKGEYPAAIRAFQEAVQVLLPGYTFRDWREMPELEDLYAENTFLDAFTGRSQSLWEWYETDGGQEKLEVILESSLLIFEVEQMLRRRFHGEYAKLFSVEDIRSRTELGIHAAIELWEQTGEPEYKDIAFRFAERSKSLLLRESMQKANAEQQAGLPEALLLRERQLQQGLADREEQWFRLQSQGTASGQLEAAEEALLHHRQAYAAWIDSLEQHYPAYYQLKYNLDVITPAQVQQDLLEPGHALVEYFMGRDMAWAFVVTSAALEVVPLDNNYPMVDKVRAQRATVEAFQFSSTDRQQLCENYRELGHELYEVLIAPLERQLQLPERLLIVPGGVLGLLPFDALLTGVPGHCDFRKMPYLLDRYEISYAYSATFQQAVKQRPANGQGTVTFAPAFGEGGSFGALSFNQPQAEAVAASFNGRAYLGQDATIARLKSVAREASVLHFATHAQANTETGDFSFIIFSDGAGKYDSLFVKDINLLPLQADLVVLSGCETFVGQWYEGEGVINLARSFLVAGASSVVSSLWSINDDASSGLMEDFYSALKSGATRPAALRKAKQQQITTGGKLGAHPVYWAAFNAIGKSGPLSDTGGRPGILLWSLLVFGVVAGSLLWRYRGY